MGQDSPNLDAARPGLYRFGDVEVDAAAHTLRRGGDLRPLEPKAFAVLLALLQRPGELLGHDELLDGVWGHRHVTPGVLTRAVAQLRAALGDDPQHPRYIQTRHALGYRFIGEPAPVDCPADAHAGANGAAQSTTPVADAAPIEAMVIDRPGSTPAHAWRPRHWLWASLLAILALAVTLWAMRDGPRRVSDASIAVLPFTTIGGDRASDYFAEGLAVELHDALAGVPGLQVAAQLSPEAARKREPDVRELGRRLGVASILDASVRREGQRIRINARLTDAHTGFTLWSHSYDRELADVFDIQAEIASEVVRSLVGVVPKQDEALRRRLAPTGDAAAFDAYLRGLQALLRRDAGRQDAAVDFRRALAGDAHFARAQAGLCRAEVANFLDRNDLAAYGRAETACRRATEMEPGLGEVMVAMGDLHLARGEFTRAIASYTKAAQDPARRVAAYTGLGNTYGSMGDIARGKQYFDQAIALRPGDARIWSQVGYQQYLAGDIPAALAAYRRATELQPDDALLWSYLGGIGIVAGRIDEASQALARSIDIEPTSAALTNLGEIRYFQRDYAGAARLHRDATRLDATDYLVWGNLGQAELAGQDGAARARAAFARAESLAARYVEVKPEDAKTLAALAWYRVNLGQRGRLVHDLLHQAEQLGGEPAEVALFNAQSLLAMGDAEAASAQVAKALAAGMQPYRIRDNAALDALDREAGGGGRPNVPSSVETPQGKPQENRNGTE